MKKAVKKKAEGTKQCLCPFCEEELIGAGSPFCVACSALMKYCANCKIVVEKGVKVCPRCGGPLE